MGAKTDMTLFLASTIQNCNITILLGECGALWGEHERVVWSICVAQAVKYSFQTSSSQSSHNCDCLHR